MFDRSAIAVMLLALLIGCGAYAAGEEQAEEDFDTVSLSVDQQSVRDVANEITNQTGIRVFITEKTDAVISVKLDDVPVEQAISAIADTFEGSWIRGYLITKPGAGTRFTTQQLISMMSAMREGWMNTLTEEQRGQLMERWRAIWQAEREQRQAQEAAQAAAQGVDPQQQQQQDRGNRRRLTDPLRRLPFPETFEVVSLELNQTPLLNALYSFIGASGFIAFAEKGIEGTATASLKDVPLEEAIDAILAQIDCEWEPIYILSQPYQMTDEERNAMMERMWNDRWTEHWAKTPEERAKSIQERADRLNNMSDRGKERFKRWGGRIISRMQTYSAGLTPEQRKELKPLIKALAAAAQ